MEILIEFLIFILKALTIAILVFVPIILISISLKNKDETTGALKIKNLSKQYKAMANSLKVLNLNKDETKKFIKAEKKQLKSSLKKKLQRKEKASLRLGF